MIKKIVGLMTWLLIIPWAAAQSYYGPGIGYDAIGNHQIMAGQDVDIRFRATTTSALNSVKWYNINGAGCGYACGTGGIIQVCVQGDDGTTNHYSSGTNLACAPNDVIPTPGTQSRAGVVETFRSPATLTAGTLYHIRFHNVDADPANNWTSLNALWVYNPTVPRQPALSDTDVALYRCKPTCHADTYSAKATPIFQLSYADGSKQGQGYMESWINAPVDISGNSKVREQFTVTGSDKVVTSVSARPNKCTGTDPITVTLETGAGTLIESGTIPASTFPVQCIVPPVATNNAAWGTYTFSTPRTLSSGQTYHLVLSAPSTSRYQTYAARKGPSYGYVGPTIFVDGYGQFSTDNGVSWTGFFQPNGCTNCTDGDVQFFFTMGALLNPPQGLTATVQ